MALFILLILTLCTPCQAAQINLDRIKADKYIEIYRKYFEKEIAADLFATQAQVNAASKNRAEITKYINRHGMEPDHDQLDNAWQDYLSTRYKSIKDFEQRLKNNYLDTRTVKNRFSSNIGFSNYFNQVVAQRIKNDIKARKHIFNTARGNNVVIDELKYQEQLQQMSENWGGYEKFKAFMRNNDLNLEEVAFFIRSSMLREEILDGILSKQIGSDNDLVKELNSLAQNHYFNKNQSQSPLYYFKMAFIDKNDKDAAKKIQQAQDLFRRKHKIFKSKDIPELKIMEMAAPVENHSNLYLPQIKLAVRRLSNEELFISKKISPVISSPHGYHIFQLKDIDVPESKTLSQSKEEIFANLKKRRSKELLGSLE